LLVNFEGCERKQLRPTLLGGTDENFGKHNSRQ
jgi:hypothetical protein